MVQLSSLATLLHQKNFKNKNFKANYKKIDIVWSGFTTHFPNCKRFLPSASKTNKMHKKCAKFVRSCFLFTSQFNQYERLTRRHLWQILHRQNISEKLANVIKSRLKWYIDSEFVDLTSFMSNEICNIADTYTWSLNRAQLVE